jgi:cytochrome c-type biogenesis protein CcmH
MKRVLAAALLLVASAAPAIDPEQLEDPVLQQRYSVLINELRCLKCQGETIADTPIEFAVGIRRQIREQLVAGRSDAEVKEYLVERYGEVILLKPRSLWLWIAPAIFLLVGALIAWRVLGQRRQLLASDPSEPEDGAPQP